MKKAQREAQGDAGTAQFRRVKDRETLGRLVRAAWVAWAQEQPDVASHPSWLVPWDALAERDREVDRRIGETVAAWVMGMFDEVQS